MTDDAAPIIMTAMLDKHAFQRLDALRQAHFPPERNYLRAHLTMFHHLPGTQAAEIAMEAKDSARHEAPMSARAERLHFMGRGSSVIIECEPLKEFRARLAEMWRHHLIPQDSQGWRPHVTIQNKVNAKAAKALYQRLNADFAPWSATVEGISLWWYRGGPWEKLRDIRFRP
ncbi:MAG: 2'-5' RNA ligase family protein [Pacificimonas sp.]